MHSNGRLTLARLMPRLMAEMHGINRLYAAGQRATAIHQFHALAALAVQSQQPDLSSRGYLLPGLSTEISVCRIPAEPRPDKPIALVLPGLLSFLPLAAARVVPLTDLFDIVLCELPGHGASGQVSETSLPRFAAEYGALIQTALPRAASLFVIGESLGGLVALCLARTQHRQIRNVVLLDPPLQSRAGLTHWIAEAWRDSGSRPYIRQICRTIMGFDPVDGRIGAAPAYHDLVRDAPFNCLLIPGGESCASGAASAVTAGDIDLLRAANPRVMVAPRVPASGHAVLLDNPAGTCAALTAYCR